MLGEAVLNQSEIGDTSTAADSLDDMFKQFQTDVSCDLRLKSRGPDPVKEMSIAETLSSRHNRNIAIFEEQDKTLEVKQTIPLALLEEEEERLQKISERERKVLSNLNLPGKDRNGMPAIPSKSKRSREAEIPEFYPFCTLPIVDAERMLMLKQLQQLVKQNFLDQSKSAKNRHPKNRVFERTYENHLEPNIFRQVLSDALLDEPDIASLYYPR